MAEEQVRKENLPEIVATLIRGCLEGQIPKQDLVNALGRSGIIVDRAFALLRSELQNESPSAEVWRNLTELQTEIEKERKRRSMPVRRQAAELVREGHTLTEVASRMGKSVSELKRLLLLQVGEQELRLSDIFFCIPSDHREIYEFIWRRFDNSFSMLQSVRARQLNVGEFDLYQICRDAPRGDLYVSIADIELALHAQIKQVLLSKFGPDNPGWWRQGVPVEIRKRCATTGEEDESPMDDLYSYTTLIDLRKIMESNWAIFSRVLPAKVAANKKLLGDQLVRLNSLRNSVMHPVRKADFGKDDLDFVTSLRESLNQQKWRTERSE